jgi:hypothetical protein
LRALDQRLPARALAANAGASGETPMPQITGPSNARDADARAPAALLSPGMAAQVEIITGRRSVLSYLLSPIARAVGEAGRER